MSAYKWALTLEEGADRFLAMVPPQVDFILYCPTWGEHSTFQLPLENCFGNVVLAVGHVVLC